jgi:DMSO/TMAO reductase YedYZ heme-binding membrane subunit
LIHVRRSFGVSTFFFAVIHASLGFFHNLNGSFFFFDFLNRSHTLAIIFSTLALTILAAMALTSFDGMVRILGRKWKWLHRLVYVAALLVLAHANLIGSHFAAISTTIPKVINNLVFLFVFLEAGATLQRLQRTSKLVPKWQRYLVYFFLIVAVGMTGYYSHRSTTADANHGHEREAQ